MGEEFLRAAVFDEITDRGPDIKASDRVWVKRLHREGVVREVRSNRHGVDYYVVQVALEQGGALTLLVDPLDVGTWL